MLSAILLATHLGIAAAPAAPPATTEVYGYAIAEGGLEITAPDGRRYNVSLPCSGRALATSRTRLLVACGDEGLAIFSIETPSTPELLAVRDLGGEVVGFLQQGDQLWATIARTDARLVTGVLEAPQQRIRTRVKREPPPPAPEPEPTPAPEKVAKPAARGHVLEARPNGVVVDLGTEAGLTRGDHVALFREEPVPLAGGESATREVLLAVGSVIAVASGHAEVKLGRNEQVPTGILARPTQLETTASRYAPPRVGAVREASFHIRPLLPLGALGLGAIADATVGIRFEEPLHIQAVFEPLGVAYADEGNVLSTAGNVIASYDTDLFEIGLGAGWSAVNNDASDATGADRAAGDIAPTVENVRTSLSVAQLGRLGAADGLHLIARTTFLLYDQAFHFGGVVVEGSLPTGERSSFFARGGGGAAGFGYGEVGMRILLVGNGLRDSLIASASIGGGSLFGEKKTSCGALYPDGRCYESVAYAGPLVGLGFEWRL